MTTPKTAPVFETPGAAALLAQKGREERGDQSAGHEQGGRWAPAQIDEGRRTREGDQRQPGQQDHPPQPAGGAT
ncbi:MAG: hypothetical protein JRI68_16020 [Deltaproteobacteria bacterium]|nr:hypothetical protein [Deltaproteobacteria bacterium]